MRHLLPVLIMPLLTATTIAADADQKGLDFFESKIRPVLVQHCYNCHSAAAAAKQNLKAGLFLDSRDGSRKGGESGPAVVPGNPADSLLMSALRHETFEMPPAGKLPEEVIANFVQWIEMGAPDPRDGKAVTATPQIDIESGRRHWAFQRLSQPVPPDVDDKWVRTPIDSFIRARQAAAGVTPNATAEARTLIRRAYYDLIGLPPQPEDVDRFLQAAEDDFDTAFARLIDDLLQNEHYGERWGRHWLDVARFAESNGYAFDRDRPNAWHYRDFVIRALNADMPYDQFVRLQIAGDLLTDVNVQTTADAKAAVDTIAATGFLVAGPFTTQQTQKERERSRYEQLDDILNTVGTSLLGLTVGCSRCHDHKYDPLPQFDYYQLASCFAEVGFSDTGINMQPEAFQAAMAEFNAAHEPLVAARTAFEKEQLQGRFEKWIAERAAEQPAGDPDAIQAEVWQHIGPFSADSFERAFEQVFAPEQKVDLSATYADGKLKWTAQPEWKDDAVHNPFVGDNAANYLFRVVNSSEDQMIRLSLGSDDAIKVWVNGKEMLSKLVGRGAAAGQESVQVPVRKGRNELLIKIVNAAGPSGFYFAAAPAQSQKLPRIGNWQHIGPFTAADFNLAFDEVFPPERELDLTRTYNDGKLKWTEQPAWKDGEAHNDKLTGTNCANYLYRVIECGKAQVLALSLGSDDGIKVWINGREVLSKKVGRNTAAAGQESAVIQLAAGRNELLMKIVNGGGATGFYFAASAGQPPEDMRAIFAIPAEKWDAAQKQKVLDWYKGFDLDWLRMHQAVTRHETQRPQPELTNVYAARVRGTTYQFGADTYKVYHLRRGNADNKEEEAKPGFLRVLMTADQHEAQWLVDAADAAQPRPGRLGMADWLTDVDDGAGHLLARVIVNRLWHHHFERGIVATPSDFGIRGERPSHPELLDWLANELIRNGWRLKPIHKLIMTSTAYMQAGDVTDSGRRNDPENLLLWRRGAKRLEAEIIRDALLDVSGGLDRTMFGAGTLNDNSMRRSVYFTVKRSQLIPMLQLFDAPDTMQAIGAREESTVAPQALALMNSPLIRDWAVKFAARVRPNAETSIVSAIDRAYQLALSRPPTDDEQTAMTAFIEGQRELRATDPNAETLALRDFCHLLMCMNEFVYID